MFKLVVLSCLVACCSAQYFISPYAAPYLTPYSSNYRGPLSLAPGQPANVLGADGRPLDTLEVNLDKSAHLTAKAFDGAGIHLLKKRSVGLVAAPPTRYAYASPLFSHSYTAPIAYSAPIGYTAPIASSYGHIAPLTYTAAVSPLIHTL